MTLATYIALSQTLLLFSCSSISALWLRSAYDEHLDMTHAGGFTPDPGAASVVLCSRHFFTKTHMEHTITHELIHMYDSCKFKVDWGNLHHACSEASRKCNGRVFPHLTEPALMVVKDSSEQFEYQQYEHNLLRIRTLSFCAHDGLL
jgi:Peptidase M76 family